jgi:hypothetical protein
MHTYIHPYLLKANSALGKLCALGQAIQSAQLPGLSNRDTIRELRGLNEVLWGVAKGTAKF